MSERYSWPVAALIAAPGLLVMTGTARIVVVMIALNVFVTSFAIGSAEPAVGFVYRFLPETKGRSVEEIMEMFEHQLTGDRRAGMRPAKGPDAAAA